MISSYFPAKRFKGILYESALEVAEMAELCGTKFITHSEVDALFRHDGNDDIQLVFSDLYLPEIEKMRDDWRHLQEHYGDYIQPLDVLKQYSTLRYQTRLENGIAANHSLHNLRTLNADIVFYGTIEIKNGTLRQEQIIALALENLSTAGLKRNRGLGKIAARLTNREQAKLIEEALQGRG